MKKIIFLGLFNIVFLNPFAIGYSQTDLKTELDIYKKSFTNSATPPQQLDYIIQRYQNLFIKSNPTPASTIKEEMPSGEEKISWQSPLAPSEYEQQQIVFQSLKEILEELQTQGLHARIQRILDEIISEKLDQTANISDPDSYPDPKSYAETIEVFINLHDYKDLNDPTRDINIPHYYETEFRKQNIFLNNKLKEIEKNLTKMLNALNNDFSGNLSKTCDQLDNINETLKSKILALSYIQRIPLINLTSRTLDTSKTLEERLAAIQSFIDIMRNDIDQPIPVDESTKNKILVFLEDYKNKFPENKKNCENISNYFSTPMSSEGKKSSTTQRLNNIIQLIAQIKAEFEAKTNSQTSQPDPSQQQLSPQKQSLNPKEQELKSILATYESSLINSTSHSSTEITTWGKYKSLLDFTQLSTCPNQLQITCESIKNILNNSIFRKNKRYLWIEIVGELQSKFDLAANSLNLPAYETIMDTLTHVQDLQEEE